MSWDDKQLHWHLNTRRFGRQIRFFDEIDSTNRWLLDNSEVFTLSGGVVVTDHQTSGRGRHLRQWSDQPNASLLCSILLNDRLHSDGRGFLSMIPSIALARVLSKHDPSLELTLKWPNDILLSHKKMAGVLAEATTVSSRNIVVVGIGINVSSTPDQEFAWPATSLYHESQWHPSREVLLAELLNEWEPLHDQFLDGDFSGLRGAWEQHGPARGSKMKRIEPPHVFEGEYAGLGNSGQLLLRTEFGELQEVFSGDVLPQ